MIEDMGDREGPAMQAPEVDVPPLADKVASAAAWTLGAQLFTEPMRLIYTAILARLLSPEEFGFVGMAATFIGLIAISNDFGLAAALIQRRDLDNDQIDSVFWLNMAIGVLLAAVSWAAAPFVADFYRAPEVTGLFRALSLSFVLTSLALVQGAMVRRNMDFKTPAIAAMLASVAVAFVSIGSALGGLGAYSLVYGTLAGLIASAGYIQLTTRYFPSFSFRWERATPFLSFGAFIAVGELATFGLSNIDNLAVGRVLGAVSLGLYGVAYSLVTYPVRRVARLLTQVLFPAMSSISEDSERFKSAYTRSLSGMLVVLWPLLASAAVCANQLIVGLYGDRWAGAVPPFRALCIGAMAMAVSTFCDLALKSKGHAKALAILTTASMGVFAAAAFVSAPHGIVAVAWAVTIASVVSAAASQQLVHHFTGTTWRNALTGLAPPLSAAAVATSVAYVAVNALAVPGVPLLANALLSILAGFVTAWALVRIWPGFGTPISMERMVLSLLTGRAGEQWPLQSYRDSHKSEEKGREYDAHYASDLWTAYLWEREQKLLKAILRRHFSSRAPKALDFACGTGRISSFLEDRVGALTCVDVSDSMLSEARQKVRDARLVNADLTVERTELQGEYFDLIVAFRFFVNAEQQLREDALQALADRLSGRGIVVFNIHHHSGSPYIRLVRAVEHSRGRPYNTMSLTDAHELLAGAGLRLLDVLPAGIVHVPKLKLPARINHVLDTVFGSVPGAYRLAEDLIIVATRAGAPSSLNKTGSPELIILERMKTVAAGRIGTSSGLFYAPRVLEQLSPDTISFEWLDGLSRLSELIGGADSALVALFRRLGTALAVTHVELRLPPELTVGLPHPWGPEDGLGNPVFVHGDLTSYNVCIQKGLDRLVILDWSTAPHLGGEATFGSPYFDIALLFANSSYAPLVKSGRLDMQPCYEAFLEGYAAVTGTAVSRSLLKKALHCIEPEYLKQVQDRTRLRPWYSRPVYAYVQKRRLKDWRSYRNSLG